MHSAVPFVYTELVAMEQHVDDDEGKIILRLEPTLDIGLLLLLRPTPKPPALPPCSTSMVSISE
jgi:hypothetical protein